MCHRTIGDRDRFGAATERDQGAAVQPVERGPQTRIEVRGIDALDLGEHRRMVVRELGDHGAPESDHAGRLGHALRLEGDAALVKGSERWQVIVPPGDVAEVREGRKLESGVAVGACPRHGLVEQWPGVFSDDLLRAVD